MTLYRAVAYPIFKPEFQGVPPAPTNFIVVAASSTEATRKLVAFYRRDEPSVTGVEVLSFEAVAQDSAESVILT